MFWRFGGYANISTIDTILQKQDLTLEELLEESDLIQELKQHNAKLIEYLREEPIIKRLLEYVIAPKQSGLKPPLTIASGPQDAGKEKEGEDDGQGEAQAAVEGKEDEGKAATEAAATAEEASAPSEKSEDKEVIEDAPPEAPKTEEEATTPPASEEVQMTDAQREQAEKTRAKYSYVSCEVLSSEAWSISEALMDNLDNLRMFWKFLERPPPLDPLQAGYFTKVNETLFDKKTEEMMEFFKSIENIVPIMLKHVDCPMIMDLLLKIISMEKSEGGQGIVDWLQSKELIPRLLSFLSTSYPSTTQTSTGDFLKAIITISANASQNEQSCIGPNNLTRQLVSEACIQSLINEMLKGGNPLTVGVGIIIEVIRKNNSDYDPEIAGGIDNVPSGRDPIYLGTLLKLFARHVPDFMTLISSQDIAVENPDGTVTYKRRELKAAFGGTIEPLGFDRFKTCELMAELLHCSNMGLLNERGSEDFVKNRDRERDRLKAEREATIALMMQNPSSASTGSIHSGDIGAEGDSVPKKDDDDGFEDVEVTGVLEESHNGEFTDEKRQPVDPSTSEGTTKTEEAKESSDAKEAAPESSSETKADDASLGENVSAALSPGSNLTSDLRRVSIDEDAGAAEDTAMGSPSPPSEPKEPEEGDEEKKKIEEGSDAADVTMESPPVVPAKDEPSTEGGDGSGDSKLDETDASIVPAPLNVNKQLPSLPKDETPAIDIHEDDGVPLGLDDSILKTEGLEFDYNGKPLVGDYLKMMFVQNAVVPTILDFFFRFPWNNFLHNVVYDVVQQVFNGPMERGFNKYLAIDLFLKGRITERVVEGQKQSDQTQSEMNMRLGYMGHLTLIAEEVVKFTERHPPDLLSSAVMEKVIDADWVHYVEQTLADTRERDNAILGGVRPDLVIASKQPGLGSGGVSQIFEGGFGTHLASNDTALDTIELQSSGIAEENDLVEASADNFTSNLSAMGGGEGDAREGDGNPGGDGLLTSGFGSSSDEDDEDEEMGMDDDDDEEVARLGMGGNSDQMKQSILVDEGNKDEIFPALSVKPLNFRGKASSASNAESSTTDGDEGEGYLVEPVRDEDAEELIIDNKSADEDYAWPNDSKDSTARSLDETELELLEHVTEDDITEPVSADEDEEEDDDDEVLSLLKEGLKNAELHLSDDEDDMDVEIDEDDGEKIVIATDKETFDDNSAGEDDLGEGDFVGIKPLAILKKDSTSKVASATSATSAPTSTSASESQEVPDVS